VEDIRDSLSNIWSNTTLCAHLIKDHDYIVSALHSTANPKPSKSSKKSHLPDPHTLSVEVTTLQKNLDVVSLKSFGCVVYWSKYSYSISSRLDTESVLFMRTSKNSDHNILENLVRFYHNIDRIPT